MDDLRRMDSAEGKPLVLRVSQLVGLLQEVLEENFWEVWVEGEISNFSAPVSGHYYFVLKDEPGKAERLRDDATEAKLLDRRPGFLFYVRQNEPEGQKLCDEQDQQAEVE